MEYYRPHTVEEAVNLKDGNSLFIAGGTDLGVMLADAVKQPGALIDLSAIGSLDGIRERKDGLVIGPCTKIADIASSDVLPAALTRGAAAIGSPQIRNMATIGGNICNASPCGDTLTPLTVFHAVFTLQGREGSRTITTGDFFRGPKQTDLRETEILTEIFIPGTALAGLSGFRMTGKRNGQAISQVNMALRLTVENGTVTGAVIAAGSVAPVPIRLEKCEQLLTGVRTADLVFGAPFLKELAAEAEAEVMPISDIRAGEDYRRSVSGSILSELVAGIIAEGV